MPHSSPSVASPASQPIETASRILNSTLASADFAESIALGSAQRAGFSGIALEKIGLAVHEIVINAIVHGNGLNSPKKVLMNITRTRRRLTITVSDQGDGFDLRALPDPRSSEALLKKSGRGIYLAQAFMDEFHAETGSDGGTTVTLVKYIRGSGDC
jgi:serine/threonine-protein kinase RsbW